jgi:hypothetical protein
VWPRYAPGDEAYLHLNGADIRADNRLRGEACDLFRDAVIAPQLAGKSAAAAR